MIYIHGAKGSVYDFTLSMAGGSPSATRPSPWTGRAPASAPGRRAARTRLRRRRRCCAPRPRELGLAVRSWSATPSAPPWRSPGPSTPRRGGGGGHTGRLRAPARRPAARGWSRSCAPGGRCAAWAASAARVSAARSSTSAARAGVLPGPRHRASTAHRAAARSPDASLISDGEDRKVVEAVSRPCAPLYPSLRVPRVIVVGAQDRIVPPRCR